MLPNTSCYRYENHVTTELHNISVSFCKINIKDKDIFVLWDIIYFKKTFFRHSCAMQIMQNRQSRKC